MSRSETSSGPTGDTQATRQQTVWGYLRSDLVNTALYILRIGTVFSCLAFIVSVFVNAHPSNVDSWYRRALLASEATSALRLHQRFKGQNVGFSMAALQIILAEDSFHYLLYSIMFTFVSPVSAALIPIFLFALRQVASTTQILLKINAPTNSGSTAPQTNSIHQLVEKLVTKVTMNDELILRIIALNEIFIMAISIFMAFFGPRILVLPFMYFPFLRMRYFSRRNAYSRLTFQQLRYGLQNLACNPKCPVFATRLIYSFINLVSRLGTQ